MPLSPERKAQQRDYWRRKGKQRRAVREGRASRQRKRDAVQSCNVVAIQLYRKERRRLAKRIAKVIAQAKAEYDRTEQARSESRSRGVCVGSRARKFA